VLEDKRSAFSTKPTQSSRLPTSCSISIRWKQLQYTNSLDHSGKIGRLSSMTFKHECFVFPKRVRKSAGILVASILIESSYTISATHQNSVRLHNICEASSICKSVNPGMQSVRAQAKDPLPDVPMPTISTTALGLTFVDDQSNPQYDWRTISPCCRALSSTTPNPDFNSCISGGVKIFASTDLHCSSN
jgi:hypothetical protein